MHRKTPQYVRVGLFVALALSVLIVSVLVIGNEHSLFKPKTRLYTSFADINGLVEGAPVRLAGVDVGRVTAIAFSADLQRSDARIELAIENRYMDRVRSDSRAFIDSKGLLGDKIINLSVGTPSQPRLQQDAYVQPRQGLSFESLAKQVENTASQIGDAASTARLAVGNLASPEVTDNLRRASSSLAAILGAVEHGDGLAHAVVYDPAFAARTETLLANLAGTSVKARAAATRIDDILAQVEHGPGTLNTLVYGSEAKDALLEWQRAGNGIAELTSAINHGDGLAQALIHDQAGRQLLADLGEFGKRLNHISADVERGRGTLGALIVDPSVYEDMKTVLGNIERNTLLKAVVRWTIKQDGIARPALEATQAP